MNLLSTSNSGLPAPNFGLPTPGSVLQTPMYYATEFVQVLGGTAGKPIDIILLGGIIRLCTHPGDTTSIAAENMNESRHMPHLRETETGIRIDKQSLLSFLPHNDDLLRFAIYVPEGNDVNILLRGGKMRISGHYGNLRVRNDAGIIKVDLPRFSVSGMADLKMFAGEIRLLSNEPMPRKHRGELRMPIGENGTLSARVSLGEVRFKRKKQKTGSQ